MLTHKKIKISFFFIAIFFGFFQCFGDLPSDTVYLTWQKDPTTTMTIQWVSNPNDALDKIQYRIQNELEWNHIEGYHFPFPRYNAYSFHRVELTNLTPDTLYEFRINENEKSNFSTFNCLILYAKCFCTGR